MWFWYYNLQFVSSQTYLNMKAFFFIVAIVVLTFFSCQNGQSKIDNAVSKIEYAEKNTKEMSSKDWKNLDDIMTDLESDLELNRGNYNEKQIKEIGKIKGRYKILELKKEFGDLKESLKDFGQQIDGAIESLKDTTNK